MNRLLHPDRPASARARVLELLRGYVVADAVHAAVALGIADVLAVGPRPLSAIAAETSCDQAALGRLLTALGTVGMFHEIEPGWFGLGADGDALRADSPDSARQWTLMTGALVRPAVAQLADCVRTGRPAAPDVFGNPLFTHLTDDDSTARLFHEAMTESSRAAAATLVELPCFKNATEVVDIGGGHGHLLAVLLARHPQLAGVLYDRPEVIARLRHDLPAELPCDRTRLVAGDFFDAVPSGGQVYVLSWILHDWDDERAHAILANCHRAMPSGAHLILVESLRATDASHDLTTFADLVMLALLGGRERTLLEWEALLEGAGFTVEATRPADPTRSIIETRLTGRR